MLIPIGTTMEHKRQPIVTYWIIGLNVLVFALQWTIQRSGGLQAESDFIRSLAGFELEGQLSRTNFHYFSLITYQFLHGGWMHIIVNMIFLLPFGKAVEDRMGHIGFGAFYLGCGAIGGLVHLLSIGPVIGASGSVCAVVAAFLVLAPKTKIHVLLIFFIIGVYTIPSLLLVGFFVALDLFGILADILNKSRSTTAWDVHLAGYISGFAITFAALKFGFIRSSEFDLTLMIRQFLRRRSLQKTIDATPVFKNSKEDTEDPEFILRTTIAEQANTGSTDEAATNFFEALKTNPSLKIDPHTLHTLGSSLLENGNVKEGVAVFERYLQQYKEAKDRGEVALLLAAKYARVLNDRKRALDLLKKYAPDFSEQHKQLATSIQQELTA